MARKDRAARVDRIADHLVKKFDAPQSRGFFCKCGWKLSEAKIWDIYERAHTPGIEKPIKYFVALCQIEMGE